MVAILGLGREFGYTYGPMGDMHLANVFVTEMFSTIAIIFATGPIKVFLEVQSGKTSVKDLKDGFEDRRAA